MFDGHWRTDNISLAAYLRVSGIESVRAEWMGSNCFWFFDGSDELSDLVAEFFGGQACVDPIAFSKMHTKLKDEMRAVQPNARR